MCDQPKILTDAFRDAEEMITSGGRAISIIRATETSGEEFLALVHSDGELWIYSKERTTLMISHDIVQALSKIGDALIESVRLIP